MAAAPGQDLPDSHISTGGAFPSLAWLGLAWLAGEEPALGLEPRAVASLSTLQLLAGRRVRHYLPFARPNERRAGVRRMAEPSRTPSTKAHRQILDFQKNTV